MADKEPTARENVVAEPFPVESVPWEDWAHGDRFGGRVCALSKLGGGSHVGVLIEELPPGKQSCPAHYHFLEEEHVFMLAGRAVLRLGEKRFPLSAGDYVCFPAGQQAGHCLVNEGDAPCRYLVIGEKNPNDVVVYPDSGKVLVKLTDELYKKSATMGYWDGE